MRFPTKRLVISFLSLGILFSPTLSISPAATAMPTAVKNRFVVGEPKWQEIPVKDSISRNYRSIWNDLVGIIIENGFDISTMEKDSGYIRTNENGGLVVVKGKWRYDIKVIAKVILNDELLDQDITEVEKIRFKVYGNLAKVSKKTGLASRSFNGYDKLIVQDLFDDMQLIFGRQ